MAKSGSNKARNQTYGEVNAPWFTKNVAMRRKANKKAKAARKRNRKK